MQRKKQIYTVYTRIYAFVEDSEIIVCVGFEVLTPLVAEYGILHNCMWLHEALRGVVNAHTPFS
jgi:hypothetical protein